jgi:membrane fusion protein, multidrug efflux system
MNPPSVIHPRRLPLAAAGLVACGLALLAACGKKEEAAKGPSGVPVVVAAVERRDVPQRVSSIGTVRPLNEVVIRPQVTGILTEVLFREGQMVAKGAPLARIDDRSIAAALAQVEAEKRSREAQLKSAELDLERYAGLVGRQVVSRQQIDQQQATVDRLKAEVLASEATIAAQRVQLSHTHISSPLAGRVGIRRVDPGNLVQASDEAGLVTVTQIDPISIVFTVPQEVLGRLRMAAGRNDGMKVKAFDRDAGTALGEGRITTFDNQIDPATGTLRLRAQFANPGGTLWPGQFVALQLETSISPNLLAFPARAIQQGLDSPYVFRIVDGKAEVVQVKPVYQDDQLAAVAEGLAAGDSVVTDGQSRLKPGTKVRIPEAAGASSGSGS